MKQQAQTEAKSFRCIVMAFSIYAPFLLNRTKLLHIPDRAEKKSEDLNSRSKDSLLVCFWVNLRVGSNSAFPSVEPSTVLTSLRCLALQIGRCQYTAKAMTKGDAVSNAHLVQSILADNLGMSGCLQAVMLHLDTNPSSHSSWHWQLHGTCFFQDPHLQVQAQRVAS